MEKIEPPLGYRLLEEGETIPAERMIWINGVGPWFVVADRKEPYPWTGKTWHSKHWVPVAVPIAAKDSEVPAFRPEWVPKPFTPNKYTRDLLSLDGRRVPVDVYSVLAAFPSNNGAVDHALKKLLAPGQRGQKDRLQDLKEARQSLDRAIQMEGG